MNFLAQKLNDMGKCAWQISTKGFEGSHSLVCISRKSGINSDSLFSGIFKQFT